MCAARRVAARVGGVEAVDVGQQHQLVGLHHLGDARGQPVVVAEADFGGGDGVVLVDHRDAAEAEQRAQRGARVEVAAAVLGVVQRQQQLRGGEALGRQRLAPGLRQADLARRRRRPASPPAAAASACRPSARRASAMAPEDDHDHLGAARAQRGDVGGDARRASRRAARPSSRSTTSALPIFTTSRWAAASRGQSCDGAWRLRRLASRLGDGRSCSARSTSGTPWPVTPDSSITGAARTPAPAPPAAPTPRAASSRRPCSAR